MAIPQVVFRARPPIFTVALLAVALLSISGCGGPGYSLEPVSGIVTLKGEPLANASVIFTPATGQSGPSSYGSTDDQGHYQLATLDLDKTGAVLGTHRVTITTAKAADPNDERSSISKELVPRKYRDGSFQMEVIAGGTTEANVEVATK